MKFEQRRVMVVSDREKMLIAILDWLRSRHPLSLTIKLDEKGEDYHIEAINLEQGITY